MRTRHPISSEYLTGAHHQSKRQGAVQGFQQPPLPECTPAHHATVFGFATNILRNCSLDYYSTANRTSMTTKGKCGTPHDRIRFNHQSSQKMWPRLLCSSQLNIDADDSDGDGDMRVDLCSRSIRKYRRLCQREASNPAKDTYAPAGRVE